MLRSRSPALVAQEVWAHLLVHYALRVVLHTAALEEDLDPDRLVNLRMEWPGEACVCQKLGGTVALGQPAAD